LVFSEPDAHDDRQFAVGRETDDVLGGDRGVIDDHAGSLAARLGGLARGVVEAGCGHLGDRRDIIEQRKQSLAHRYLVRRV